MIIIIINLLQKSYENVGKPRSTQSFLIQYLVTKVSRSLNGSHYGDYSLTLSSDLRYRRLRFEYKER